MPERLEPLGPQPRDRPRQQVHVLEAPTRERDTLLTDAVGDCEWVILTLGDQPRVTPQVIAAVVDQAVGAPAGTAAVRTTYDGAPGHPVALGRAILPQVAALSGDVGARELLGHATVRTFEAARLCDPTDVDTPEELEALRT